MECTLEGCLDCASIDECLDCDGSRGFVLDDSKQCSSTVVDRVVPLSIAFGLMALLAVGFGFGKNVWYVVYSGVGTVGAGTGDMGMDSQENLRDP